MAIWIWINDDPGGTWTMSILQNGIRTQDYVFVGEMPDNQFDYVTDLAEYMQMGEDDLIVNIGEVLEIGDYPGGNAQFVADTFGSDMNPSIFWDADQETIFTSIDYGAENILEVIEQAGEALASVL